MRPETRAHGRIGACAAPYSVRMVQPAGASSPAQPSPLRRALRWAVVLGAVGFAAGFFGPMRLNPEANIGPLVGILMTGPAGFIGGLVLGFIVGVLPLSETRKTHALALTCLAFAAGTLFYCLPEPALRGYVIDAQVADCAAPAQSIDAAAAQWDQAVARVTWANPTPNWKRDAVANVERDPGVVLTLRILRKSAIMRHRRPWDRDRSSARPWSTAEESRKYYANDAGSDCTAYLTRARQLYWPAVDPNARHPRPAPVWPPTDTLGFLQLQSLEPVPPEYRRLLQP
jgi:hypothetical protein